MNPLRRQCAQPRCPRPALEGSPRCQAHTKGGGWIRRGSSYGSAWPRLRAQVLREEPRCQLGLPGCTVVSTEADHIVPRLDGGSHDRANLRGVCASCHRQKTHSESVIGRKRKRERARRYR
jgi:5-methylcytosine-specific restriction protein A